MHFTLEAQPLRVIIEPTKNSRRSIELCGPSDLKIFLFLHKTTQTKSNTYTLNKNNKHHKLTPPNLA